MIRLRQLLDQQLQSLHHATSKLANRLQRKLMAKQNRTVGVDLEEVLDAARLSQVIIDPINPLVYKQEKEMKFRDTVYIAYRQLWIDARSFYHDRGNVRRYTGENSGTLLCKSRNLGLQPVHGEAVSQGRIG